jgi:hypothetical protein
LKNSFNSSYNYINNNKQDNLLFTLPLLKDISNNITIDLSGYAIGNRIATDRVAAAVGARFWTWQALGRQGRTSTL